MTVSQKTTLDLLYLIGCALKETEPEPARVQEMDLENIYALAAANSLGAIACAGLGEQISQCPEELAARWTEYANMSLRRAMLLDLGRETILSKLEEAGIWYLPLKGSILQNYYPDLGLREMSDNDILFDASRRADVTAIMQELGYDVDMGNHDNHDVYTKLPVYNYEMHLCLMGEKSGPVRQAYYGNIREKLLPDGVSQYGLQFREEDFYVYFCAHGEKHYSGEGTGLRVLADTYVYLRSQGAQLDQAYLSRELAHLQLSDYEQLMRLLSEKVFDAPELLTAEDFAVLDYLSSCGVYGNKESAALNGMRSMQDGEGPVTAWTKLRYMWRRICPDKLTCQLYFPFFAKYPWLKPFWVVYRIFRAIFFRRGMLKSEFRALSSVNDEQAVS